MKQVTLAAAGLVAIVLSVPLIANADVETPSAPTPATYECPYHPEGTPLQEHDRIHDQMHAGTGFDHDEMHARMAAGYGPMGGTGGWGPGSMMQGER